MHAARTPSLRRLSGVGALLVLAVLVLEPPAASALDIDFDDGTAGLAIGTFYADRGVTFSNAVWDGFVSPGEESVDAGGLKLVGVGPDFDPGPLDPIVAVFSPGVSAISIRGLNVGNNGARIDAYDAAVGGTLLDFDEAFGVGAGTDNHPLLSVASATPIRRIELYQPLETSVEGMLFDNLSVVPEPASALLVLSGALGLAWQGRRRQSA